MDPHGDNFPVFPVLASLVFFLFAAPAQAMQEHELIQTIITAESSGRCWVSGDGGKARGLMQIQRSTWERLSRHDWNKAFNPALNIEVGTKRVREIARKWKSSDPAYIAYRYNCGDYTKLSFKDWKRKQPNKTYRRLYA